jgi:hypothetical protein
MSTRKLVGYEPNPCDPEPLPVYEDQFSAASPQPAAQPSLVGIGTDKPRDNMLTSFSPEVLKSAQPEQPEPGVLTDEQIDRIFDFHNEAPTMGYRYEVARAVEREVLSTRKLSDERVERIMLAVDTYGERRWTDGSSDLIYQPDKSLAARADIERLLRGEA